MTAIKRRVAMTHGGCGRLSAYRCEFCGQFHIGHPPANVVQSINARRGEQFKTLAVV